MNKHLHKAKKDKNDEFYTQLIDIENELNHYKDHFKNKTIYCNCDSPDSNFFKYFKKNFKRLGLKKLIVSCYKNQQLYMIKNQKIEKAMYLEYTGDDYNFKYLKGDGDFRSKECIELLKESDIIVTNPPFSLFRKYLSQLIEYDKKFLIIGHQNAITYKEIFPLITDNKVWLGYGFLGGTAYFTTKFYKDYATAGEHKEGMIRVSGVIWYTNLSHKKRNEELILIKNYYGYEKDYPKYDNYDAIEVNKVINIPKDYIGIMGVPITFMDKYNSEQFEIIKFRKGNDEKDLIINGKCPYFRILIKRIK